MEAKVRTVKDVIRTYYERCASGRRGEGSGSGGAAYDTTLRGVLMCREGEGRTGARKGYVRGR